MAGSLLVVQEIGVQIRGTEKCPSIDVIDRTVQSGRSIKFVNEQIRKIATHGAQLKMNGERRGHHAQIRVVQIECLRMSDARRSSDILQDHRWNEKVHIAWNDDLDRLGSICCDGNVVSITIQDGEGDRTRHMCVWGSGTSICHCQSVHDRLQGDRECIHEGRKVKLTRNDTELLLV